jgi:uncharacterized protein (TIGR02117 family)
MKNLALLLTLALLYACSGVPHAVQPQATNTSPAHRIHVVSHGWHTGLVVPAAHLNQRIPALAKRFGHPAYYEIGWGDKGFYQAKEITTGLTLQAMFWATGAIVHIVAVPNSPHESFPRSQILETCVSEAELAALTMFISNSLFHDEAGQIISIAPGIYGDAQFYEGTGRYHILNTCNTWTAKGLSSAGYDISPTFTLTASSVMDYLADQHRECPQSAR